MARRFLRRPAAAALAAAALAAGSAAVTAPIAGGVTTAGATTNPAATRAAFVPPPAARVTSSSAGASGAGFRAVIHHWTVDTGPRRATACSILGELFVPDGASASNPVPAILTTNGFGGSYADQVPLAEFAARHGYVVLTYSGLGFGGSGCNIELDSPLWDGEAASQLVSYLGRLPDVLRDGADDPRVGMVGGSYGGEVQFAAASVDPRIDAIVPIITWNDLSYSLAPDNTTPGLDWRRANPGVLKWQWASLFFADGLSEPFQNPGATPVPPSSCPGFDPGVCNAYAQSVTAGYPTPSVVSLLRADSVVSYYRKVHVPVLLMQGEQDSLFNLDEAVANYRLLRSMGDPVKLVLQSWGHSNSTPAPGELSYTSLAHGYETVLVMDWFARYLEHEDVSTGPAVEYFRPWVRYDPSGSAAPAYGTAPSWPVGSVLPLYLSGNGALVRDRLDVVAGSESFAGVPPGEPASYSETSGVQDTAPFSDIPPSDPPGTTATFETPPLPSALDSVGIPVLHVRLTSPVPTSTSPTGPESEPVVFAKIYDLSPTGSVTLVNRLVAPARLTSPAGTYAITLPGVVHRYAKGDRIELVVATSDQAYLANRVPQALSITVSPAAPGSGVLDLPVVLPANERAGGPLATGA